MSIVPIYKHALAQRRFSGGLKIRLMQANGQGLKAPGDLCLDLGT
jgi:hypothetical protein